MFQEVGLASVPVTVERDTSKCCCDMAFGSGGAWGRAGGWQHGRLAGKHWVAPEMSLV